MQLRRIRPARKREKVTAMLRRIFHSDWLGIGIVREARLGAARRGGRPYNCIFLSLIFVSVIPGLGRGWS
jgi:hypothetical protein